MAERGGVEGDGHGCGDGGGVFGRVEQLGSEGVQAFFSGMLLSFLKRKEDEWVVTDVDSFRTLCSEAKGDLHPSSRF